MRFKNSRSNRKLDERASYQHYYINYYYNLFMGAYKWNGLDYQQEKFLMNEFWATGTIGALNIPIVEGENLMVLVPYSPTFYNQYNFPIFATPVRLRMGELIPFIPVNPLKVDEEIVLGWAQKNKKSVCDIVSFFVDRIVDVEMTIKTQLIHLKNPVTIATSPEDTTKVEKYWDDIKNDEEVIFVESDDPSKFNVLQHNIPYVVGDLYSYKKDLENELLTYLGIDNVNIQKKERLITDEAESNNALINDNSDNFLESMKEFCERVNAVLGANISVEAKASPKVAQADYQDSEGDGKDETMV